MKYLQLNIKHKDNSNSKNGFWLRLLTFIIPKANPDFDDKIDLVTTWLLEFENEESLPNREMGLNDKQTSIVKMPDKRNMGYWTDNNLTYQDFISSFDVQEIEKSVFDKKWEEL